MIENVEVMSSRLRLAFVLTLCNNESSRLFSQAIVSLISRN